MTWHLAFWIFLACTAVAYTADHCCTVSPKKDCSRPADYTDPCPIPTQATSATTTTTTLPERAH